MELEFEKTGIGGDDPILTGAWVHEAASGAIINDEIDLIDEVDFDNFVGPP